MLAERAKLDMDEAFQRLRAFARANNRRLSVIATGVVAGEIGLGSVRGHRAGGASSKRVVAPARFHPDRSPNRSAGDFRLDH
jgi:hypothetical protein